MRIRAVLEICRWTHDNSFCVILRQLPCESDELRRIHDSAKRAAKVVLRIMPVREGKLKSLLTVGLCFQSRLWNLHHLTYG